LIDRAYSTSKKNDAYERSQDTATFAETKKRLGNIRRKQVAEKFVISHVLRLPPSTAGAYSHLNGHLSPNNIVLMLARQGGITRSSPTMRYGCVSSLQGAPNSLRQRNRVLKFVLPHRRRAGANKTVNRVLRSPSLPVEYERSMAPTRRDTVTASLGCIVPHRASRLGRLESSSHDLH
jgi:hypothetical protein